MKFSENYQHHQTPRWIRSYCNYDKLKGTLRRLRESTSSEETAKLREYEIKIVEKAVAKRLTSLRLQVAKVWRPFGISPELQRQSFIATISNMNHQEICHLLSYSHEQYEGQRDLQYFAKINSLAFSRILEKLKRISEGAYQSVQERLISCSFFHQIDILFQLHESKNRIEDLDNARKSVAGSINEFLLLKNICDNQNSSLHDLQEVHIAIHENRVEKLITSMEQHINGTLSFPWDFQMYTDALVRSAISGDSFKFACELIVFIGSKSEFLTFDGILIHELLQRLGKRKANSNSNEIPPIRTHSPVEGSSSPFLAMLGQLYPDQRASFTTSDESGKIPLHHAAEYGLLVEYQAILTKMEEWGCFKVAGSNYFTIPDLDGLTPLDLAVLNGHFEIVDATLQFLTRLGGDSETLKSEAIIEVFRNSLLAAIVRKDDRIVRILLENGVNQEKCWKNNESFLYIATRLGYTDIVRTLATKFSGGEIKLDEAETVYGWTPLVVACVRGFEEIVKLLVEAGADQRKLDFRGLSAKENAMFRGYVQLAGQLNNPETSKIDRQGIKKLSSSYSQNLKGHLNDGKNLILVNLGILDLTRQVIPVNLTTKDSTYSILYPESIYAVEVGLLDSTRISYSLALPLLEDLKNKPWYFVSQEAHDLKLEFKVFRATKTALEKGELVGSSIGILKSTEPKLGSGIESIIRDMTIPIQERGTLRYIGTITFTYMILTPSPHAKTNTTPTRNAWKDVGSVKVVGHRGKDS
ncbi:Glycerophosphocholine phosphodiesterase [Orbilia oligospora]|nr:Glycerophosphocholine phosphodiesterase [Orbilia oligospora]